VSDDPNKRQRQQGLDGSAKVLIALIAAGPLLGLWHVLARTGLVPDLRTPSGQPTLAEHILSALLIGVGFFALYFLPTIIARTRKRRNVTAIAALNFFLGWTVLGWVIALVWALAESSPQPVIYVQAPPSPPRNDEPKTPTGP